MQTACLIYYIYYLLCSINIPKFFNILQYIIPLKFCTYYFK